MLGLSACDPKDTLQHWHWPAGSPAEGSVRSRAFASQCITAEPHDFTGVEGGYQLWPKPQYVHVEQGASALRLAHGSTFRFPFTFKSRLIQRATERYHKIIFGAANDTAHSDDSGGGGGGGGGGGSSSSAAEQGALSSLALVCTGGSEMCTDAVELGEDMIERYELALPQPAAQGPGQGRLAAPSLCK